MKAEFLFVSAGDKKPKRLFNHRVTEFTEERLGRKLLIITASRGVLQYAPTLRLAGSSY